MRNTGTPTGYARSAISAILRIHLKINSCNLNRFAFKEIALGFEKLSRLLKLMCFGKLISVFGRQFLVVIIL